jgi:hypothetical protein
MKCRMRAFAAVTVLLASLAASMAGAQTPEPPKDDAGGVGSRAVNVMVIIYDPVFKRHGNERLSAHFKWNDSKKLSAKVAEALTAASGGFAKYRLAKIVESDSFPEKIDGFRYDESSFLEMWANRDKAHQPDRSSYLKVFKEHGVERLIRAGKIDEVWIWAAPYMGSTSTP